MCNSYFLFAIAATNPCAIDNGGCSHMCLLSAVTLSGSVCACPEAMLLAANQVDCLCKLYFITIV